MEVERELNVNLITPNDPVTGTLVENRPLTDSSSPHFTRHWVVDVSGTQLEGNMEIGQAFGVIPEWDHYIEYNKISIKSEDHKIRLYSNASPSDGENGEGKLYSTTVKRVIDEHEDTGELFLGADSNYMCDMAVGDEVKLTGPTGRHFVLPDREERDQYNYVFLAAGTGIAPFRGMLKELVDQGITNPIQLILGVPYNTDVLYGDFFEKMDEEHDNFDFQTAISRQQTTSDGEKMYVQRRMFESRDVYEPLLNDDDTLVYICGLKGMETGIYKAILQMGANELLTGVDETADPDDVDPSNLKPNKERTRVEVY
jgi:ferredoxin--NADP+ reductase